MRTRPRVRGVVAAAADGAGTAAMRPSTVVSTIVICGVLSKIKVKGEISHFNKTN